MKKIEILGTGCPKCTKMAENAEIAAFLEDLNRIAELSGLDIGLVEPLPEEPSQHYIRIPVRLRVSGRFHQVGKFFYNVSRLPRAINMENIQLTDPQLSGENVVLRVDVLATTFRRQEDAAAAPAAQPAAGGHG